MYHHYVRSDILQMSFMEMLKRRRPRIELCDTPHLTTLVSDQLGSWFVFEKLIIFIYKSILSQVRVLCIYYILSLL